MTVYFGGWKMKDQFCDGWKLFRKMWNDWKTAAAAASCYMLLISTDQLDVVAEWAGVVHPVALAPHHLQKMVEWRLVIVEDKNILPGIDELLKCNFFSSCKLWIFIMWRGGERGKSRWAQTFQVCCCITMGNWLIYSVACHNFIVKLLTKK